MTAHPELVSGTGRNDVAFMQAGRGDWVTKVGAEGVQVVASRSRGEALALKIADGNKLALFAATVEALDQLGMAGRAAARGAAALAQRDDLQRQGRAGGRAQGGVPPLRRRAATVRLRRPFM